MSEAILTSDQELRTRGREEGVLRQGLLGGPEAAPGEDRGKEGVHPKDCHHLIDSPNT